MTPPLFDLARLPRREALRRLLALGLTLPMAHAVLAQTGAATAPAAVPYAPSRRGGGGTLKILSWQGPTQLNPHFATGTKDADAARIFFEPLARWDADGELQPVLAAEIPSLDNGGVARDDRTLC